MARRPLESTKTEQLEMACRTQGVPLTIQRRVVLETLAARDDHPTADDVWEAVRLRMPDVSRTTAYRALDTLVRLGLAVKICHPGSSARYDAKTRRHHHLVCVHCERVLDIDVPALDKLALPNDKSFEVTDYSVQFRGVCAACRRARGQRKEES
ncbi:MAG TPA: transcriptional repressor [Candidatus Binatia bacterium]|jgi:Fur family peroxide stress response transcriptional regulator